MATPRKHWFKVPDSIADEDWPDDVLATLIRLQARMNTRWARNGLSGPAAGEIWLTAGDAIAITRRSSFRRACAVLTRCTHAVTATLLIERSRVKFSWPKFPEFQRMGSRELPESLPRAAPSARRKTQDAYAREEREESEKAAEAAAAPNGGIESPPKSEPLQPPEAVEFAEAFRAGLGGAHPGFKEPTPAALAKWVNEARLMLQRDQRPLEEVRTLADWLFNSPSAEAQFWRPNVLGVPKFREKFDQLQAQRRRSLHVVAECGPLERASRELAERIRGRSA